MVVTEIHAILRSIITSFFFFLFFFGGVCGVYVFFYVCGV